VDDGIKQRSIAAELELSADDAGAMSKEAWNNCVEFNTWPAGWERLTVALPPGIANLINQMACELLEREQGVGDRGAAENANVPQCHAPEVQLADIVPDHSRHPEDILKEPGFVENVRQRGVKSPISLRPHPTLPGKWLINDGYRRFWAAQAVGLRTIPYVVDVNFDSDDQLNDYLYHSPHSPLARADFIARRLAEGRTKGEIAQRLGKGSSFVTDHLALVEAPSCVHLAYAKGVKSPRTLYDLRRAHDEFPVQVEDWCANQAAHDHSRTNLLVASGKLSTPA
jgi:ParB/RepB/Spo0J family partition protein